jgi:predicted PurR-regulated permease PerM
LPQAQSDQTSSINPTGKPMSLIVIGGLALVIACLYLAQAVLIPVALAILLTFLLGPLVSALQRMGLGRVPAVAVVIFLTLVVLASIGWVATTQVKSLAAELPKYRHNIREKVRDLRGIGKDSALENIQKTVEEVQDEMERDERSSSAKKQPSIAVQADSSTNLGPLVKPIASAALVFGLLIFMLAQREELRNRLIRLVGYAHLTITTKALEEAGQRISRYLLMQITINGCFGLIIGVALFLIGLPYAFLWGFLSVPLLFIPLIGFWAAAAMPTILSLAVFTDWWWPLVVIGLFLGLKTIINMLLEPLLYGKSVGISPVALLMMIAFWTWLWGPVGLVLATPLTVCLVVFAKHVPQLEFIEVLLSDEPVIETKISYYQRLLAMDRDEAMEIVEDYLKKNPREQIYDTVLMPALSYAKRDRRRNHISEGEEQFIFNSSREILDYVANFDLGGAPISQNGSQTASAETGPQKVRILGCPAHDEADEIGLLMLRQILDPARYQVEVISARALASEMTAIVAESDAPLVCVSVLPPGGLAQARYLCKRLRALFPSIKIVVGQWVSSEELDGTPASLVSAGADQVGTTLLQTRDQIINLRQLISVVDMPPNRGPMVPGRDVA